MKGMNPLRRVRVSLIFSTSEAKRSKKLGIEKLEKKLKKAKLLN